jgi:cobalt-zinc-cadmium efflux system membrane fusion protein
MKTKTSIAVGLVLATGIVGLWLTARHLPKPADAVGPAHEEEAFERGSHRGRLLRDGQFTLELAIFETGMPPEFRAYPALDGKPVHLADVKLRVELRRLGGRVDDIEFEPLADYLRGSREIYEPHSFSVHVFAQYGGKAYAWQYESPEARIELKAEVAKKAGVEIASANPASFAFILEVPGEVRLNAEKQVLVTSRFNGVITEVRHQQGEVVPAGTVLAVIESRELAAAKSEYIEAVNKLELAQAIYTREEVLWRKKITPEQEFLVLKNQLEEAEIRKQLGRQKLLALGLNAGELKELAVEPSGKIETFEVRRTFPEKALTRYQVRAPFAGTLLSRDLVPGSLVQADQTLFQLADLSTVWVEAAVPSEQLQGLRTGLPVKVAAHVLNLEADGVVAYLSPVVQEASRTASLRVVVPNAQGLWRPGLFVTARIERERVNVPVAAKKSALQSFRDWQVVFVNEGDSYEPVVVETGRQEGDYVEIVQGLKPGMRYVSGNSFLIKAHILKAGATHDH